MEQDKRASPVEVLMMRLSSIAIGIILALLLSGCSITKKPVNIATREKSEQEIAKINCVPECISLARAGDKEKLAGRQDAFLWMEYLSEIYVDPGKYELEVQRCSKMQVILPSVRPVHFSFDALAGHEYYVITEYSEYTGRNYICWKRLTLVDKTSEEVILSID